MSIERMLQDFKKRDCISINLQISTPAYSLFPKRENEINIHRWMETALFLFFYIIHICRVDFVDTSLVKSEIPWTREG